MKATLKFNIPEDQQEFDLANDASRMHATLMDLHNYLRSKVKHSDEVFISFDKRQDVFMEFLEENEVNIFKN